MEEVNFEYNYGVLCSYVISNALTASMRDCLHIYQRCVSRISCYNSILNAHCCVKMRFCIRRDDLFLRTLINTILKIFHYRTTLLLTAVIVFMTYYVIMFQR